MKVFRRFVKEITASDIVQQGECKLVGAKLYFFNLIFTQNLMQPASNKTKYTHNIGLATFVHLRRLQELKAEFSVRCRRFLRNQIITICRAYHKVRDRICSFQSVL